MLGGGVLQYSTGHGSVLEGLILFTLYVNNLKVGT